MVQPMPAPNPEPPPVAMQRADAALAKDAALGKGKGTGANTGKGKGLVKTGKGKTKAKDAHAKPGGKARTYGSIGEEPIETHRMDTPPKETTGAAKKSESRTGDNSIKILQRNYGAKRQSIRSRAKDVVNQVDQMLRSKKAMPVKGGGDFHTHKRKGKGEGNAAKRARAEREANEYMRIQGAQRGIDIADMLG
mgnify:CR=1 FL=1